MVLQVYQVPTLIEMKVDERVSTWKKSHLLEQR